MPRIQNVSLADIREGNHMRVDPVNSLLIQIVDPAMPVPVPAQTFSSKFEFEFLDIEAKDTWAEDFKITDLQAFTLVNLLKQALDDGADVVVHCVAGVCRSGAVAEVGVMMGFKDTGAFRSPNLLVKHKMMKALGWTYDEDEPHTINGVPFEYDEPGNKKLLIPRKQR